MTRCGAFRRRFGESRYRLGGGAEEDRRRAIGGVDVLCLALSVCLCSRCVIDAYVNRSLVKSHVLFVHCRGSTRSQFHEHGVCIQYFIFDV